MRRINQSQNNDRSLILFRAIAVAHRYTQRAQAVSLLMSLVVASLGVVAKVALPPLQPAVSIIGALWAGVYAVVLAPLIGRHLYVSATLQEMLDTDLFDLPWNAVLVGERLSEDELSRLSRRFRGDETRLRDYYLVATVAAPYDVLFCLEQNLAWGSRVRRRFGRRSRPSVRSRARGGSRTPPGTSRRPSPAAVPRDRAASGPGAARRSRVWPA